MAHLAARLNIMLAVEMNASVFLFHVLGDFLNIIADQIKHNRFAVMLGRSHRQAADGSHMLFKLRHGAGINCPMA